MSDNGTPTGGRMTSAADRLAAMRPDLHDVLRAHRAPQFRYKQVLHHLMASPGLPFASDTALPPALRTELDTCRHCTVRLLRRADASDGSSKLLFACADDVRIETVIMRYPRRSTVCVSSQAGCPLACAFCATGRSGFRRNLTAAEIIDQAREAAALLGPEGRRLSNVVFMGMGEPLLNLDAVLQAIRELSAPDGLGIGRRSIAVSTVGIPQAIVRLAQEAPQVHLALSLHAPDNRLRSSLMPVAKRYSLRQVLDATAEHFRLTHRKLLVEYVLLQGLNDTTNHARQLAALLRGRVVTVNLLAWNRVEGPFRPSAPDVIQAFAQEMTAKGIETVVRAGKGQAVHGACGQLAAL